MTDHAAKDMDKTEIFHATYGLLKICNEIYRQESSINAKEELSELGRMYRRLVIEQATIASGTATSYPQ